MLGNLFGRKSEAETPAPKPGVPKPSVPKPGSVAAARPAPRPPAAVPAPAPRPGPARTEPPQNVQQRPVQDRRMPDGIGTIPPSSTASDHVINAKQGLYGEPLTLQGGAITVTDEQRADAILFSKGILLIAVGTAERGSIASLKEIARTRHGDLGDFERIITHEIQRASVAQLYEEFERRAERRGRGQGALIDKAGDLQARFLAIASEGIARSASDIHIIKGFREKPEDPPSTRIEFRIDRLLETHDVWSYEEGKKLIEAAFNLTDEGSASQNGVPEGTFVSARISAAKQKLLDHRAFGLRLQFNSTTGADQEIVFRILYKQISADLASLETMGFADIHLRYIDEAIRRPNVLNWISGMVNSGKSTTQRAILSEMHRIFGARMKISTLENPVEFVLPFAVQHDVRNGNYIEILEAQLRSDRNAVSIGETRKAAEAESAFVLVTTGMRGWTTVHAPDAIGTLDRCRAWNLDPHFYTNHRYVGALISQKLFSRPCPSCGVPLENAVVAGAHAFGDRGIVSERMSRYLKASSWDISKVRLRGTGNVNGAPCRTCGGKGYKGATLVAEVILPDAEFMAPVKAGDFDGAEKIWFERKGNPRLVDHGVLKMLRGLISPDDLDTELGPIEKAHADPEKAK